VLHAAAGEHPVGLPAAEISFTVRASGPALLAKMAAMSAHASQIGPEYLDPAAFDHGYGQEWFVRRGPAGPLEQALGRAADDCSARFAAATVGSTEVGAVRG
jgi:hypothetical protein